FRCASRGLRDKRVSSVLFKRKRPAACASRGHTGGSCKGHESSVGIGKTRRERGNKNGHPVCQSPTQGKRAPIRRNRSIHRRGAASCRHGRRARKRRHAVLAARSGKIERRKNVEGQHRASCRERNFGGANCRCVSCSWVERWTLAKFPPFIPSFDGHPASQRRGRGPFCSRSASMNSKRCS